MKIPLFEAALPPLLKCDAVSLVCPGAWKTKGRKSLFWHGDFGPFAPTQGLFFFFFLVFHEALECALLFPTGTTLSQVELLLFSLQRWPRKRSGLEAGCSLWICPEERRDCPGGEHYSFPFTLSSSGCRNWGRDFPLLQWWDNSLMALAAQSRSSAIAMKNVSQMFTGFTVKVQGYNFLGRFKQSQLAHLNKGENNSLD